MKGLLPLPLSPLANAIPCDSKVIAPTVRAEVFMKSRRVIPLRVGSIGLMVVGFWLFSSGDSVLATAGGGWQAFSQKNIGLTAGFFHFSPIHHRRTMSFLGRLATYKYLDMDDVVAQVLVKPGRWALSGSG